MEGGKDNVLVNELADDLKIGAKETVVAGRIDFRPDKVGDALGSPAEREALHLRFDQGDRLRGEKELGGEDGIGPIHVEQEIVQRAVAHTVVVFLHALRRQGMNARGAGLLSHLSEYRYLERVDLHEPGVESGMPSGEIRG